MLHTVGLIHLFIKIQNYNLTFIISTIYIRLIAIMFQQTVVGFYYYKIINFYGIIIQGFKISLNNL